MTIQKWGGLASFLLAATLLIPPVLYIVSEFNRKLWPVGFPLADFLFGPLCGASLVLAVYALRERIGGYARHQMSLALLAAALAAAMFVTAASFRSANRQYLQYLEGVGGLVSSDPVMSWKTIVAGVIGTGRHFLGWSLILTGSAGLSSKALPRLLCILYLVSGALSLFAYLIPVRGELALVSTLEAVEATMVLMSAMCAVWQGIVLSRGGPGATPTLQPSPEPA